MDFSNVQLCRICVSPGTHINEMPMVSIFGDDALWKKIITIANIKIESDDKLPQQVCITCAKNIISACLFKQKCEEADKFFRQQLLLQQIGAKVDFVANQDNDDDEEEEEEEEEKEELNHSINSSAPINIQTVVHNHDEQLSFRSEHNQQQSPNSERTSSAENLLKDIAEVSEKSPINGLPFVESQNDTDDNDGSVGELEERCHNNTKGNHQIQPIFDEKIVKKENEEEEEEEQEIHYENNDCNDDDGNDNDNVRDNTTIDDNNTTLQKTSFDFHSIRLMHEYMLQQQLSKINGGTTTLDQQALNAESIESASDTDDLEEDEEPLPLIPEIELITPNEEPSVSGSITGVSNTIGDINSGSSFNIEPTSGPNSSDPSLSQMREYQCPHCFQIFDLKQTLKDHMQRVHGSTAPVYECTNCKKSYFYKRFLEKHIRRGRCVKKRRNQTRPMQCSDCHVLFPTGHHLGWHKRTGCPSKTDKTPLQQLFKQNIVQYNNFPKRIGIRKPENAIYVHNRKLIMANSKRKGRTRIKLDAKKIALAKQLILREATTTVIANELNISRTFAWRLRKSLVNGVSLHERVLEPNDEEAGVERLDSGLRPTDSLPIELTNSEESNRHICLKVEQDLIDSPNVTGGGVIERLPSPSSQGVATSVIQRNEQIVQIQKLMHSSQSRTPIDHQRSSNSRRFMDESNQRHRLLSTENSDSEVNDEEEHHSKETEISLHNRKSPNEEQQQQHHHHQHQQQQQLHQQQLQQHQFYLQSLAAASQVVQNTIESVNNPLLENGTAAGLSSAVLLPQLSSTVVASLNSQLPVNLSIRALSSMQDKDKISSLPHSNSSTSDPTTVNNVGGGGGGGGGSSSISTPRKKPRKPNVFIDDEKYTIAKMLVAQNASTMEIAKALNVSQMTAWKLRDAIIKGVPLSYRSKRDIQTRQHITHPNDEVSGCSVNTVTYQDVVKDQQKELTQIENEKRQPFILEQQNQNQQHQQIKHILKRQQHEQRETIIPLSTSWTSKDHHHHHTSHLQQSHRSIVKTVNGNPRRRLKAAEREMRDKEITLEILELIKEDSNIQYWKVSARLAEKGYAISPSSVCQKLKSMGIHRRWKPGDKPPMLDMVHLKTANSALALNSIDDCNRQQLPPSQSTTTITTTTINTTSTSPPLSTSTVVTNAAVAAAAATQHFEISGAHFLSAFTR